MTVLHSTLARLRAAHNEDMKDPRGVDCAKKHLAELNKIEAFFADKPLARGGVDTIEERFSEEIEFAPTVKTLLRIIRAATKARR